MRVLSALGANRLGPDKRGNRTSGIPAKTTSPITRLERSRSAADASRETNGAVVACWLR